MTITEPERDARIAELLEEARAELHASGECPAAASRADEMGLAQDVADLIDIVDDLVAAAQVW